MTATGICATILLLLFATTPTLSRRQDFFSRLLKNDDVETDYHKQRLQDQDHIQRINTNKRSNLFPSSLIGPGLQQSNSYNHGIDDKARFDAMSQVHSQHVTDTYSSNNNNNNNNGKKGGLIDRITSYANDKMSLNKDDIYNNYNYNLDKRLEYHNNFNSYIDNKHNRQYAGEKRKQENVDNIGPFMSPNSLPDVQKINDMTKKLNENIQNSKVNGKLVIDKQKNRQYQKMAADQKKIRREEKETGVPNFGIKKYHNKVSYLKTPDEIQHRKETEKHLEKMIKNDHKQKGTYAGVSKSNKHGQYGTDRSIGNSYFSKGN